MKKSSSLTGSLLSSYKTHFKISAQGVCVKRQKAPGGPRGAAHRDLWKCSGDSLGDRAALCESRVV